MAAPTGTATTVSQIGNREDLTDILERVAPENTPLSSNIKEGKKAKAIFHEWQLEDLDSPDATNASLEGDDTSTFGENNTVRVGNICQIIKKPYSISRTQEKVDKAGRKSEIARHRMLKGIEAKRDFEARIIGNYASNNESGSTPRRCGGVLAWIETNTSRGSGGADGGYSSGVVAAATNGTQRAFAESQVKTVMQSIFNESGEAKKRYMYMGAAHKQGFSAFTGISDIRSEVSGDKQAVIYGAADMYMSDFGMICTIPVAYGLTRDVLIADHDYLGISTLDALHEQKLGKTGDADKRQIIMEKTLEVRNEKALGVIADLS